MQAKTNVQEAVYFLQTGNPAPLGVIYFFLFLPTSHL